MLSIFYLNIITTAYILFCHYEIMSVLSSFSFTISTSYLHSNSLQQKIQVRDDTAALFTRLPLTHRQTHKSSATCFKWIVAALTQTQRSLNFTITVVAVATITTQNDLQVFYFTCDHKLTSLTRYPLDIKIKTRNSSGDEITNVNFLYDDIVQILQNTIDSCINSATDRCSYVLERICLRNSVK